VLSVSGKGWTRAEQVSEGSTLSPSSSEGGSEQRHGHSLMNCEVVPAAPAFTTLILPSAYGPLKGSVDRMMSSNHLSEGRAQERGKSGG
jgi:hypothetical protein